jgi:hypothetical protein
MSFITQAASIRREFKSPFFAAVWKRYKFLTGAGFQCDKNMHCNSQMTACVH